MPDELPNQEDAEISELEKRLAEASSGVNVTGHVEHAKEEIAKLDDQFHERLKTLEEKAAAHKEKREIQAHQEKKRMASEGEAARGLGLGMTVAYILMTATLLGVLVGYLFARFTPMGKALGQTNAMGIFTTLGMIVGVWMVIRLTAEPDKK